MSAEKLGPRFAGADGTPAAKSSGKLEKIKVPTAAEAQAKREAKEREKAAKKERERQRNERWREKEREKLKKKSEKEAELAKKAEERLKRATPEGIKKAATENWLDRAGELIEQHEQETRGRGEMSIDLQLSDAERLNELAAEINAAHGEVIEGALRSLGHAFRVGELLIKARKLIEQQHGSSYGHWMPWVKQHCAFSHSTSEDYVWVAEHRAEIEAKMGAAANSEHAPNFTIRGARRLLAPPKQEIIPPEPDASPDMPAPEAPKDGDAAPTAPTPQRRRCKPPKAPDFVPASGKPAKAPDFVPGPVTEDDSTDSGNLRDLFDRIVAIIPEELAAT